MQPLACASSEAPKLPASNAPFLTMTCLLGSGCRGRTGPQNCPRQRGFNVWPGWPGPQPFHTCAHTHTGTRTLTGHTAHVTKKAEKDKGAERRWTSRDPQDTGQSGQSGQSDLSRGNFQSLDSHRRNGRAPGNGREGPLAPCGGERGAGLLQGASIPPPDMEKLKSDAGGGWAAC